MSSPILPCHTDKHPVAVTLLHGRNIELLDAKKHQKLEHVHHHQKDDSADTSKSVLDIKKNEKINEHTPLLINVENQKSSTKQSYYLQFWNKKSPLFRWFLLFLITLIPLGPHLMKYVLTSIASYIVEDKRMNVTYAQLGSFQSALSIPTLGLPILGGLLLDLKGSKFGTLTALTVCLIGQILFTIACWYGNYLAALISRVIFGLGQGTSVVSQSRLICHWFVGKELVFAVSITEASHDVSQWLAKVYPVFLTEYFQTWIAPLWVGCGMVFLSLASAFIYFSSVQGIIPHHHLSVGEDGTLHDRLEHTDAHRHADHHGQVEERLHDDGATATYGDTAVSTSQAFSLLNPGKFSVRFYLLCCLYMLFSNSFHLFSFVSVIYMQQDYKYSVSTAAWVSSLSSITGIFLCPLAGWSIDKVGYKMYICAIAGLLTSIAFLLLALVHAYYIPVISMGLLSMCISFVPTILRSSIPNLVHPALFGTAYSIYIVCEAFGNLAGHAAVGYIRDITGSYEIDLYIFTCMSSFAAVLTLVISFIDYREKGILNKPSHYTIHTIEEQDNEEKYHTAESTHKHYETKEQRRDGIKMDQKVDRLL